MTPNLILEIRGHLRIGNKGMEATWGIASIFTTHRIDLGMQPGLPCAVLPNPSNAHSNWLPTTWLIFALMLASSVELLLRNLDLK